MQNRMRSAQPNSRAPRAAPDAAAVAPERLPGAYMALDGAGRILSVNARWAALLGRSAGEAAGQAFADLVADRHRRLFGERWTRFRQGATLQSLDLELSGPGGTRIVTVFSAEPERNDAGELLCAHCLLMDVTERRRAEATLVETERLAAVGRLAAGVAHQFNNLNAPILGFADLILRQDDLDDELRRRLELIRTASGRARDITDNLLAFAELRRPILSQAYSLRDVVTPIVTEARPELTAEGIRLEAELGATPPVRLDEVEIARAVTNLVSNARHALLEQPDPVLRVETGCDGTYAYVRVADNGCGIPESDLTKLFAPFFSAKGEFASPTSPQARVRGVGLGLSVCQAIARHHGGDVQVEADRTRGVAFVLRIPVAGGAAVVAGPSDAVQARDAGAQCVHGRVLVVDDDDLTVEVLRAILLDAGYAVTSARDGALGLLRLQEQPFDIVLADLQMPGMHGTEFLHLLCRAPAPQRPTPIVVTGKATGENLEGYADLPVFATLRKPFEPKDLVDCIERAMAARRRDASGA